MTLALRNSGTYGIKVATTKIFSFCLLIYQRWSFFHLDLSTLWREWGSSTSLLLRYYNTLLYLLLLISGNFVRGLFSSSFWVTIAYDDFAAGVKIWMSLVSSIELNWDSWVFKTFKASMQASLTGLILSKRNMLKYEIN